MLLRFSSKLGDGDLVLQPRLEYEQAPNSGLKVMNSNQKCPVFLRWILVGYLSLVVEKFVFASVTGMFMPRPDGESMGFGLVLVHVFVLPFVQFSIWQLGGNLAMFSMLGFALTSYMLCLKGMWKIVPVFFGSLALIFSLMYDLTMSPKMGVEFLIHFGARVVVITLVSLLGLNANRMFDRFGGGFASEA